ncbi:MAG: PQQ-binding-like beta-propeller repeat protein, partial [Planctomycetota bacterium]
HFEEAFKVLQKLIRIPSIASNLENEKIFGEKLVVHEEYPLEGKRVSFRQKALQRLSKLSVEELELYQTIYDGAAKPLFEKGLAGDLESFKVIYERYPFSSYGDDALQQLASRELDQGHFERAIILMEYFLRLFRPETTSISYVQVLAQFAWAKRKLGILPFEIQIQENLPTHHQFLGEISLQIGDASWNPYYDQKIQFQGKTISFGAFLQGLLQIPVASISSDDWPTFMGNAARNRRMPSIRGIGKKLWSYHEEIDEEQEGFSTDINTFPVISAGRLITQLSQKIVCLDLSKGTVLWKTPDLNLQIEKLTDYRGGTVHDGYFYTVATVKVSLSEESSAYVSYLWCFDIKTGKLMWKRSSEKEGSQPKGEIRLEKVRLYGAPVILGDFVICPGVKREQEINAYLHWFNRKTGELLLQKTVSSKIRSENEREGYNPAEDPALGGIASWGGIIYFSTGVGVVAAFEGETGEPLWVNTYKLGTSPKKESHLFLTQGRAQGTPIIWWFNPPLVSQGFLYVTPTDISSLLRYSRTDGTILDLYPTILKNTRFQYLLGVLPDQTFLLNGPYVFQMANLNYPESTVIGEHPTMENQILGPGFVTETDVFLLCAKM